MPALRVAALHCNDVLLPMQGLNMFPAMVIVPTLQICWTLFSIVSGMLYFQEYRDMHGLQAAMFALGVLVSFSEYTDDDVTGHQPSR